MNTVIQWRQFYTIVIGKRNKKAAIIPITLSAEFVRIEITILTYPRPTWYRAGWINQAYIIGGQPKLMPGLVVPLAPSIFEFSANYLYQVRFKPVIYLPPAIVKFYRAI
jgi:hypothetical protein